jgi:polyisoprenoid-binding protein YceI
VASYEVDEIFLEDNRFNTAVGRTNAVAGEILVNPGEPSASRLGEIVIDISQLKSDSNRRDNAIRRQWLESREYPRAMLKNAQLVGMPASVRDGVPFAFRITGDMTVHAATRRVTWNATATLQGDTLRGKATTQFKMSQFNVDPPNIAGFVKAEDETKLTLEFVATAVR